MQSDNPFTREYFDGMFAADPDPWNFETSGYEQEKYRRTLEELPFPHFRRALEVGCANGALTEKLAPRCGKLVAIDVVETALERARTRMAGQPHVEFQNLYTPYEVPEGPFDLILLSEVVCYWDDEGIDIMAEYLRYALEPGGHVLTVQYILETGYPKTGDEAIETLQRCAGPGFTVVKALREQAYRLDLWRYLPDAV